jgi:predicted SprT family Zn-dependent metalloprotease
MNIFVILKYKQKITKITNEDELMKPYITEEIAKEMSAEVFAEAIAKWNAYWIRRNRQDIVLNTKTDSNIVVWRKIGFRMAGRTSKQVINGKKFFQIEMNINYLYSSSAVEFIKNTLIHELAHVLANKFNNSWGHDKTFKTIAQIMGDTGERCHNYAVPENKPVNKTQRKKIVRISVVCPHCGKIYNLTPYMYKQCQSGTRGCSCGNNAKYFVVQ